MSKDLAASVRARLLNLAKAEGSNFNQVLVRYALERFLYRLSQSAHADRFVLKGAGHFYTIKIAAREKSGLCTCTYCYQLS